MKRFVCFVDFCVAGVCLIRISVCLKSCVK